VGAGPRVRPRNEPPARPGAVSFWFRFRSSVRCGLRLRLRSSLPFRLRSSVWSSLPFRYSLRYSLRACQPRTAGSDTVSHAGGECAQRVSGSNRGSDARGEYPEPAPGADRGRHSPGECETRRADPVLVIHASAASVTASPRTEGRVPSPGASGDAPGGSGDSGYRDWGGHGSRRVCAG